MHAYHLPKQLLYHGNEGTVFRQVEGGECRIGCLETAEKGRCIVGFWGRGLFNEELGRPEFGGLLGLGDAGLGKEGIRPFEEFISVLEGIVALFLFLAFK